MKRVFQYTTTLHRKTGSTPCYQMISQSHSSDKIGQWLRKWKIDHIRGKDSNEVILDESAALLLACVSIFTRAHSLHGYLTQCYECLFENGDAPTCYIRLDRSHVVASILRNKNFEKVFGRQTKAKSFYRRLVGFLILQSDIEEVERTIRVAFTLVYNRNLSGSLRQQQKALVSKTNTLTTGEETKTPSPDSKFHETKSKLGCIDS